MLPEIGDRLLGYFERRMANPKRVKQAARLLERLAERGPDPGVIPQIQRLRLRRTMHYVCEHSPFYREMFEGCRMRPGDIREPAD